MWPDAFEICLLKQTVSGAQSATSPSKIERGRALEADLSSCSMIGDFIENLYRIKPCQAEVCSGKMVNADLLFIQIKSDITDLKTYLKIRW